MWDYFEFNFLDKEKARSIDKTNQEGKEGNYESLLKKLDDSKIQERIRQLVDEGFLPLSVDNLHEWEPYEHQNFRNKFGGTTIVTHQNPGLKTEYTQKSLKCIEAVISDLDFSNIPGRSGMKEAAGKILERGRELGVPVNFKKAFEQIAQEIYSKLESAEADNLVSDESPWDSHITEKEFENILQGEEMEKAAKGAITNILKKIQTKTQKLLRLDSQS